MSLAFSSSSHSGVQTNKTALLDSSGCRLARTAGVGKEGGEGGVSWVGGRVGESRVKESGELWRGLWTPKD